MSAPWVSPSSTRVLPAPGLLRPPLAAVLRGLAEMATPATHRVSRQLGAAGSRSVSRRLWDATLQRCPAALQPAMQEGEQRHATVPPTPWGLCCHLISWLCRHPGCSQLLVLGRAEGIAPAAPAQQRRRRVGSLCAGWEGEPADCSCEPGRPVCAEPVQPAVLWCRPRTWDGRCGRQISEMLNTIPRAVPTLWQGLKNIINICSQICSPCPFSHTAKEMM